MLHLRQKHVEGRVQEKQVETDSTEVSAVGQSMVLLQTLSGSFSGATEANAL